MDVKGERKRVELLLLLQEGSQSALQASRAIGVNDMFAGRTINGFDSLDRLGRRFVSFLGHGQLLGGFDQRLDLADGFDVAQAILFGLAQGFGRRFGSWHGRKKLRVTNDECRMSNDKGTVQDWRE